MAPLRSRFAWVYRIDGACPACGMRDRMLMLLEHLRDRHGWDREALMAFVDAIEARGEGRP